MSPTGRPSRAFRAGTTTPGLLSRRSIRRSIRISFSTVNKRGIVPGHVWRQLIFDAGQLLSLAVVLAIPADRMFPSRTTFPPAFPPTNILQQSTFIFLCRSVWCYPQDRHNYLVRRGALAPRPTDCFPPQRFIFCSFSDPLRASIFLVRLSCATASYLRRFETFCL